MLLDSTIPKGLNIEFYLNKSGVIYEV
jgi:hypothetical protein